MTIAEIVLTDDPCTELSVTLDGVTIGLRAWWNARAQGWYLDVRDASGSAIASGLALVTGRSLLSRFGARTDMPGGILAAIDTSGLGQPIGRNDLGARARLYYFDVAELAA
jgi:hypothetical protein